MNVECPSCHSNYNVDPSKIPPTGARFKCRKCSSIVEVKLPANPEEDPSISENKPAKTDGKDSKKRV